MTHFHTCVYCKLLTMPGLNTFLLLKLFKYFYLKTSLCGCREHSLGKAYLQQRSISQQRQCRSVSQFPNKVSYTLQIQQEVYFVSSQKSKPSLFGLPVIVPCCDNTTHQDLYQCVWLQVARLVSPLPPSETAPPNHAMDW